MQEKLHMTKHPGTNPPPFPTKVEGIDGNSLILTETYCYPRGGGQPGDTGKIISESTQASILHEVLPGEKILHPVDEAGLFRVGQNVICEIDIDRRNGHTMMHTAQHMFSALAEDLWGAETVGNQIGATQSRVDLHFENKEVFDPDVLVSEVNTAIQSRLDVKVHDWDRKKIMSHDKMRHTKFMHRIPESITHLRVVEVDGIDLCPCAGTHVSNTSQIPRVTYIGKKNKGKGRIRVSYEFE